MKYNPAIHNRRSVRLKEYDYSQQGAYFITICCHNRTCLFGEIINGEMVLNVYGQIAYNEWLKTTEIRPNVELDVFVIMPNHIHGIIIINNNSRGVSHTPCSVLHTPCSASHTPCSVSHRPTPILHPTDNRRGVLHAPYLKSYPQVNHNDVCDTPVGNNIHSSVPNQGVCNTPLRENIGGEMRSPSNNIGAMVRGYKSAVTKQINILGSGNYNQSSIVWQRSFHEHIIRNEKSYQNISDYIVNNPSKWNADTFHKS